MVTLRCTRYGGGYRWLAVIVLVLWFCGMARAQTSTTPPPGDIPQPQVEELIRLLEDEQARTVFLQRLKALALLQATTEAAPLATPRGFMERVILAVESAVQQTLATSQDVLRWLTHTPQHGRNLWHTLSHPDTHRLMIRTLQQLVVSLLPGVLVLLGLRRIFRPLTRRPIPVGDWPLLQRFRQALVLVVARVLPFAGLVIVTTVLLRVVEVPPDIRATARFLLIVLLVYQTIAQCLRIALEPDDATARLLPFSDETAHYLWIWARRFLYYGVAYSVIIHLLDIFYATPQAYQGVRGVLLCVFPVLVTILVAQIARQYRRPATAVRPETDQHVVHTTRRVLSIVCPFLVIIYAWALTGFLIMHHAHGVDFLIRASIKTVVVTLALFMILRLFNRLFEAAFRISEQLQQRFPLLEAKANRYLRLVRDVCNGVLVLLAVGMIFEVWGVPVSWVVTSPLGREILTRTVIIALTLAFMSLAISLSKTFADALLQTRVDTQGVVHQPDRKRRTLVPLALAVVKVAIVFVAVLIILEQLNVNTGPVLAGVGILGLAVGFGAQSLVKDVINGLFILFEDSVSVGDVAVLRGTGGLVEKVTLRAVTLRDLSGNVHVIPNSSIDMVSNLTKDYSRYVLDVGVAYREDVDEVISILQEIDADMRADPAYGNDMLEPIEIMGLDRFADSAIIVRARLKTKPIQQWRIGREFNRRMKKIFDERGIEIPFPHRTLYWGMPKRGPQEPLHVAMHDQAATSDKT